MWSLESGCRLPRRGHQDAGLAAVEVEVRRFFRSAKNYLLSHVHIEVADDDGYSVIRCQRLARIVVVEASDRCRLAKLSFRPKDSRFV
jgi:hypothetical protein